jgi:hypothetical protein
MKKALFPMMMTALMVGCAGEKAGGGAAALQTENAEAIADETIYGLACDGCNDTILVFLTLDYDGSDPDTLNILEASRCHQVFGQIRIGDKLAIVPNAQDSTLADMVIVIEDLMGQWGRQVLPTLRERADMEGLSQRQKENSLPDSIRELLSIPQEYTFVIKPDNMCFTRGSQRAHTTDEVLPVEYPKLKRYREWHIAGGNFLFTEVGLDTLGNETVLSVDTTHLLMLTPDSLVFQFPDGPHAYYKKIEE